MSVSDLQDADLFSATAFCRNIGLLSEGDQLELSHTTVAIPGMGGVGGYHATTLARLGLGHFKIADYDSFELANFNRQFGATTETLGRPKVDVMAEHIRSINPFATISTTHAPVTPDNIESFLDGVDIVVDGIDFFAFDARRLLFKTALAKGIAVITAGPIGFGCALLVFVPNRGMGFDEYFDIKDGLTTEEKIAHFHVGLTPWLGYFPYFDTSRISHNRQQGPSLGLSCALCAGVAATEVVRLVLHRGGLKAAPHYLHFDAYLHKYKRGYLPWGNRGPLQRLKIMFTTRMLKKRSTGEGPPALDPTASTTPVGSTLPDAVADIILAAATKAPSGDNCQPWRFKRDGNAIEVLLDASADTSFFNVEQCASAIACGAAIENMVIAGRELGFESTVTYLENDREQANIPIARVAFSKTEATASPLYQALWRRHTNRKPYDRVPLLRSSADLLRSSVRTEGSNEAGVQLYLATDDHSLRTLRSAVFAADRVRVETRGCHEHLMQMVDFNGSRKSLGMPLKTLEAGQVGDLVLRATRKWSVMERANPLGLGRIIATLAAANMSKASAAGLLTVRSRSLRDFAEGGRALERLWLTATSLGLYLQPMTAITCFTERLHRRGESEFPEAHREFLRAATDDLIKVFPDLNVEQEGLVCLFRLGRAKAPSAVTSRDKAIVVKE